MEIKYVCHGLIFPLANRAVGGEKENRRNSWHFQVQLQSDSALSPEK